MMKDFIHSDTLKFIDQLKDWLLMMMTGHFDRVVYTSCADAINEWILTAVILKATENNCDEIWTVYYHFCMKFEFVMQIPQQRSVVM